MPNLFQDEMVLMTWISDFSSFGPDNLFHFVPIYILLSIAQTLRQTTGHKMVCLFVGLFLYSTEP